MPQIVVVGAGIAGLATAAALQQHRYDVTVVEERTDTSSGAGISLWPNALAALDHLGLGEAVRENSGQVSAGAVRWRDGSWLRRPAPERFVKALGEPLTVVQRSVLRDILAGALAPGTVAYGLSAVGLGAVANGVRIQLSDTTVRTADAVIGADGTRSVVARHLNGPLTDRYVGYTGWRGVATYDMHPELAGETLGPGIEVGHVPMGAGRMYWFATEPASEGWVPSDGDLAYLKKKFADWPEPIPNMLTTTAPGDVLRTNLYDRTPARTWARGAMVLAGDAAHPMRPHLGQGGCQGLEDAVILGSCVDQNADLPNAFQQFAAFRRRRIRRLVRGSTLVGKLVNLRPAFLSSAASHVTALVPETLLAQQMASVAARSAFILPSSP